MTTPNLDTTQYQLVKLLARFTLSIEYQKEWNNVAADALSWVISKLDAKIMKSILDGVTMEMTKGVDAHDPVVTEADEEIHNQSREL